MLCWGLQATTEDDLVGVAFVATSFGINYVFAARPLRLYLIDAGYMVALLAVMGAVLGGWR